MLGRMKNVEVVFYCDVLLVSDDLRGGTGGGRPGRMLTLQEEVRRKAKRAVEVLLQAKELRMVTVSWIDAGEPGKDGEATNRARVLIPLRELRDKVAFRVGRVTSSTVSVRQGREQGRVRRASGFCCDSSGRAVRRPRVRSSAEGRRIRRHVRLRPLTPTVACV